MEIFTLELSDGTITTEIPEIYKDVFEEIENMGLTNEINKNGRNPSHKVLKRNK